MSVGRKFSVGVGATVALVTGWLLVLIPLWGGSPMVYALLAAGGALLSGVLVGLVHLRLTQKFEQQIERLRRHIESLAQSDAPGSAAFRGDLALAPLASSVERTVAALRRRAEDAALARRELEVQVRIAEAERQHAEAILNSIADAVIVTDAFNEIALANETAARVLGFDLDASRRRPVERVVHDPTLVKLIKDTREGGSGGLRRHLEHKLGVAGRETMFDVTLSCVAENRRQSQPSENGGVVTILRDITREKEIAEMKSDFVSAVSHELRTPLSSIKAYMEMLVDGEANDEKTRLEFYNIIQGEANRLSRLIDNILNISRIESGVVKVQREHVSIPQLIKEAIDVMLPQARAKHIELVEVSSPVFFQVFADKDMIYQALLNLISNAIKYTPNGGRVTISIAVDEHEKTVGISITDTGVGIPPSALPHLFEKFYRVAEHKKMAMGTGLGLNLVKHIVETVHGGHVKVESEQGKGSTFTFSLPMADGKR